MYIYWFAHQLLNWPFVLSLGANLLYTRLFQGLFPPGQGATIGVDFMIKTVEVDNEKVKVRYIVTSL